MIIHVSYNTDTMFVEVSLIDKKKYKENATTWNDSIDHKSSKIPEEEPGNEIIKTVGCHKVYKISFINYYVDLDSDKLESLINELINDFLKVQSFIYFRFIINELQWYSRNIQNCETKREFKEAIMREFNKFIQLMNSVNNKDLLCPEPCKHLYIKQELILGHSHHCRKYDVQIYHAGYHPRLTRCYNCLLDLGLRKPIAKMISDLCSQGI